jgi:hypothetical protein
VDAVEFPAVKLQTTELILTGSSTIINNNSSHSLNIDGIKVLPSREFQKPGRDI